MEYKLINQNFSDNYMEQLIATRGGDSFSLLNPSEEYLQDPIALDHMEEGAQLLDRILKKNGRIVIIVD